MTERIEVGGMEFWQDGDKFYQQADGTDPMEVTESVWRANQERLANKETRPISEFFDQG